MKPYFQDNLIQIYNKDCRSMSELPDESVQMVCTSPPYWGLRKYAGEQELIWGGRADCEHKWDSYEAELLHENRQGLTGSTIGNTERREAKHGKDGGMASFCSLCGAWRGQYGLEPTPEMYVQHTIEILREIRRVLRKDGVVFWNIGDSYASNAGGYSNNGSRGNTSVISAKTQAAVVKGKRIARGSGRWGGGNMPAQGHLKPKDLCLIPFRIAIAAQEDGWWVRSIIIWSKNNPMPESVTDRPTESHEYILMLTKSARYYWDADAVRECRQGNTHSRGTKRTPPIESASIGHEGWCKYMTKDEELASRNIRSVWEFPTQPYPEAHFAVFPEKLPELCIKAATPEVGCCSKCGAPWGRVTEVVGKQVTEAMEVAGCKKDGTYEGQDLADYGEAKAQSPSNTKRRVLESMGRVKESSWQPTCSCNADKIPSLVLDPFLGSGTTLWVAKKLGRRAVGYELSEEYCALSLERNRQMAMELNG